ncbi:MAG TPA: DNA repair protein RecN [Vicinamibacterales bacterium]|nr:DNA repair protein RecN [Vicinamibacterales bacterium]
MLRFLRIEHLAVIDAVQVEFEPGLNVLTGETGAGKSMLVEAVGLLMGGRASADLIRTGEQMASVQAEFDKRGLPPVPSRGSDPDDAAKRIVRRDITSQGRSRAFANDTLVTAAALAEQTAPLVELHGQHEHQTLLDPQSHLLMLDEFAGLSATRDQVGAAFRRWKTLQAEYDAFQMDEREKAARLDLLKFQLGELEKAALRAGEDDELETTRRVLSSADKLQRLCGDAYADLYDSDEAALARLGTVWKRVSELAEVDSVFQSHVDAREAIKSQLEDLAQTLRSYADHIDASPARLQQVEDRLALIDRLKRKYGPSLADVIAKREVLSHQLDALTNADERRAGLEAETHAAKDAFLEQAGALSRKRRDAAKQFGSRIQALLGELAMGRTQFEVRFEAESPEAAWSDSGIDVAECYLSANVGEDPRPLARIASGGELSRVMLAIRTLAAAGAPGKTLIFDEIDAGIGGRVADVVGKKLRHLGESFQVLCITHLPQIAAAGHVHFHISKSVANGRTHTRVVRLSQAERVEELARMIGGAAPNEGARAAARELLGESESEQKPKAKITRAKAKT